MEANQQAKCGADSLQHEINDKRRLHKAPFLFIVRAWMLLLTGSESEAIMLVNGSNQRLFTARHAFYTADFGCDFATMVGAYHLIYNRKYEFVVWC